MATHIMKTNREIGKEQGIVQGIVEERERAIKSLVATLKPIFNDIDIIHSKIIENPDYSNVSLEDVKKYYN